MVQLALLASTGVLVPPAAAQDIEAKRAVVLDFGNLATASPLAGDEAAAALSLALVQRRYEVTPRSDVQARLKALGVRAPFEPDEIKLIKTDLDIRDLYSGSVINVDEKIGAKSTVEVLLRVEVYDGDTGDLVNGAYGKGFEILNSGNAADREAGRASAIERAIAQALTRIDARTLIHAAVMSYAPPNRVLINKGRKQGVVEGMEFNVFRTKADPENPNRSLTVKVGRIRVVEASNDDATASVVEQTQGINTHDELREVFRLPSISASQAQSGNLPDLNSRPARGGSGNASWLAPVAGVAAGILLLGLGVVMAGNSTNDAPSAQSTGAYLRQTAPGQNPSVEVAWGDRNYAPPKRFIGGYLVYRGISQAFSALTGEAVGAVPGASQRKWADDPTWVDVTTTIPLRYERITDTDVQVVETSLDVRIVHQSPQPGQTYYYKVRRLGPPMAATAPTVFARSAGSRGSSLSAKLDRRSAQARAAAAGKVLRSGGNVRITRNGLPLITHRQVTSIDPGANYDTTLDPATDNDIALDTDMGLSDATVAMGPVTYLVPPGLLAPANNNMAQSVDDVGFSWQGVLGATQYVVQMATDADFSSIAFSSASIATTSSGQLSFRYNSTAAGYQELSPNTQYFWRVGAKSTFGGQRAPEPDGYIFSQVYTFQTADQPPVNPRRR